MKGNRRLTVCQQTQLGEKRGCPLTAPSNCGKRSRGGWGGAEINDTEAGFNKEGTEEEKKKRRERERRRGGLLFQSYSRPSNNFHEE